MEALQGSICRVCRLRLSTPLQTRTFATSSQRASIPPESPHYVDVPSSYQPASVFHRQPKGILPVPRELFPARRPDKASKEYALKATPDKLRKNVVPPEKMSELEQYKTRMALKRKQHLRQGLAELYARKKDMDASVSRRSASKQAERARLISQAEREDARLTKVSTPTAMQPGQSHALSDVDVQEIYERKKANLERTMLEKAEDQRDELHTLYMHARKFITTEDQLLAEIEAEFQNKKFYEHGKSMWSHGRPDTVEDMIKFGRTSTETKLGTEYAERYKRDQERMQKIAEKLSGGKM